MMLTLVEKFFIPLWLPVGRQVFGVLTGIRWRVVTSIPHSPVEDTRTHQCPMPYGGCRISYSSVTGSQTPALVMPERVREGSEMDNDGETSTGRPGGV